MWKHFAISLVLVLAGRGGSNLVFGDRMEGEVLCTEPAGEPSPWSAAWVLDSAGAALPEVRIQSASEESWFVDFYVVGDGGVAAAWREGPVFGKEAFVPVVLPMDLDESAKGLQILAVAELSRDGAAAHFPVPTAWVWDYGAPAEEVWALVEAEPEGAAGPGGDGGLGEPGVRRAVVLKREQHAAGTVLLAVDLVVVAGGAAPLGRERSARRTVVAAVLESHGVPGGGGGRSDRPRPASAS